MSGDGHVYSWRENRWIDVGEGDYETPWFDDPDQIELVEESVAKMAPYWQTESEGRAFRCGCGRIIFLTALAERRLCSRCTALIHSEPHDNLSEADYQAAMTRVRDYMEKTSKSLKTRDGDNRAVIRKQILKDKEQKAADQRERILAEERHRRESEQNLQKIFSCS